MEQQQAGHVASVSAAEERCRELEALNSQVRLSVFGALHAILHYIQFISAHMLSS